jgi:hypothetical protein
MKKIVKRYGGDGIRPPHPYAYTLRRGIASRFEIASFGGRWGKTRDDIRHSLEFFIRAPHPYTYTLRRGIYGGEYNDICHSFVFIRAPQSRL